MEMIDYTGLQNRGGHAPLIGPTFSKVFWCSESKTAISFGPTGHNCFFMGGQISKNNLGKNNLGKMKLELTENGSC